MSSATATLQGRLTADPELRYTQNGMPVVNFTIAHNPRILNRSTNEWEDSGDALFMRVTAWRHHAEHIAGSLRKGTEVVAIGRLKSRTFEHDGQTRTVVEFEADVIAVDLRRQTADVRRASADPAADAAAEAAAGWTPERSDALEAAGQRAAA